MEVATMTWSGGDPWVDSPQVTIETQSESGAWGPKTRHDGSPLTQSSYEVVLSLQADPPYTETLKRLEERQFIWQAAVFATRKVPTTTSSLYDQPLRFRVQSIMRIPALIVSRPSIEVD